MFGILSVAKRELWRMGRRRSYLWGMILVPLGVAAFFLSLLSEGLPLKVPSGVVDLDHSEMSRTITRSLQSNELVDVVQYAESYDQAMAGVRRGETFGFFVIPANFESDALGGRTPTLEYYSNLTYFVPGTFTFKGFKTVAVSTSGGVVRSTLSALGVPAEMSGNLLQPVVLDGHPLHNPWVNYSYYLTPSFAIGILGLMIMLMCVYSITTEIKMGTSPQWLAASRGNIVRALLGKMVPHTVIFYIITLGVVWMMIGYRHFPMNGSLGWILLGALLFVIACQGFGLMVTCALPNPRLALSVCSLFGILTFSFAGFSFPVTSMYGAIGVFSYLSPVRYFYLIYTNEALNGLPLYYSRLWYAALLVFPFLPLPLLGRLRRACLNPVYVP